MNYTYEELIKELENTFTKIEQSFQGNKNSRFYKAYKKYKIIENLSEEEIQTPSFIEGINDLYQLMCIIKCEKLVNSEFGKKEISKIWEGSELAANDTKTTPRDIQFQLYMMSLFNKYFATDIEEPDFSINYLQYKHYVAVKRISSEKKINFQIKNAQKQIVNCGKKGIIIIGLDKVLFNLENEKHPYDVLAEYVNNHIYTQEFMDSFKEEIKAIVFTFGKPTFDKLKKQYGYASGMMFIPIYSIGDEYDKENYGKKLFEIFKNNIFV